MAVYRDSRTRIWRYRKTLRMPDGTTRRISGTPMVNTKVEAESAERSHILRVLNPPTLKKEVPTFKKFVNERWWPVYPDSVANSPTTRTEKEGHIRLYLMPHLADVPLDRVGGEVVAQLFANLKKQDLAAKTLKNVQATLRKILQTAVDWGVLPAVPALQKIRVPKPEFDFLTRDESDRLIEAAGDPFEKAILHFAIHTGVRAGEQRAFKSDDIEWSHNRIVISRSLSGGVVRTPKGGKTRRIPMTPTLASALKILKRTKGALLFCNRDGSPLTFWQLRKILLDACQRAGLRQIRWHDLRHSFASQLAIAGVPIPQIQQWMGHVNIQTTMRYAHLAPGTENQMIKVLDSETPCQQRANGKAHPENFPDIMRC